MTFLINGEHFNLCHPYQGVHVWFWDGAGILSPFPDDLLCSCGAIHYKNRNHPERELEDKLFKELEDASIYDYLKFEREE